MEKVKVESSTIKEVEYDMETSILIVNFKNCKSYEYYNVPIGNFRQLVEAESVGKYFTQFIKGQFTELFLI